MFWDSITFGLSLLRFGDIYIAGLLYVAMYLSPVVIVGWIGEKAWQRDLFFCS